VKFVLEAIESLFQG